MCCKRLRDLLTPPPHLPQPLRSLRHRRSPSAPAHTSSRTSTTAARTAPGWERMVPDHRDTAQCAEDEDIEYTFIINANDDPQTLAEAQARPDWPNWHAAMDREVEQLECLGTYELAQCLPDRKHIGCKWVFRLKRNIPGVDYVETFAPVVRLETLRTLLAIGAALDLDICVIDIVSAYLNGELQEEIYMQQPPMYENGHPVACCLRRTLYGLKQSGREWNLKLDAVFATLGFTRLLSDQCVYLRAAADHLALVAAHVDDMTTLTSSPADSDTLADKLESHFELSKLSDIRQVVGLEVEHNRTHGTLTLRQAQYIVRVLERFSMANANPIDTPLDANVHLVCHDGPEDPDARSLYQAIVGSLMYAALGTRPDIAHAAQQLSQYSSNPGPVHLTVAKRILRYLKGAPDFGLTYRRADTLEPFGFSDADWANDLDDRKSISEASL
ncbi:hypothetical protein VTO73DRAFT_15123 [Trametes versicolor]